MLKEQLVTFTQIIKTVFPGGRINYSVFWTFAIAGKPDFTCQTLYWKAVPLVYTEVKLILCFY